MKEYALQSRTYKYKKKKKKSVLCKAEFRNIKKCAQKSRIYKYKNDFSDTEFMNIKLAQECRVDKK